MGHELAQAKQTTRTAGKTPEPEPPRLTPPFVIPCLAGNQAIQRLLEGQIPLGCSGPEFQQALHPKGVWRMQAQPRLKPEQLQGLITLNMPPGFAVEEPPSAKLSDTDFIVASDEFGVTIIHPGTETRIRVVEQEHRYKPEEWTYETRKWPKETPAISYQLIAPEEEKPGEVLIAIGPGAFVEVEEPAPYEGAKEWHLVNWQPRMGGRFAVTIIEMPDNSLVPLPHEDIDVATLLKAGGKMHYPDKHTWNGAISYEDYVMTIGMLIADLLFLAIPLGFELAEAAMLASEAARAGSGAARAAGAIARLESEVAPAAARAGFEEVAASRVGGELAEPETLAARLKPEVVEPELSPPAAGMAEAPEAAPERPYIGGRRARSAASKRGIELRKKMAYERLSKNEYDPLQDLLTRDELNTFMDSGGRELPKDIDWHHTVQTSQNPAMADVPEHIQPLRITEHRVEHLGDPGKVPTAGIRGDVTTPERPIYDPNAPEVRTRGFHGEEPVSESTLEEQGFSELPHRKPPNFRDIGRVRDPALRPYYDYEVRAPDGTIYRREIATREWIVFPR